MQLATKSQNQVSVTADTLFGIISRKNPSFKAKTRISQRNGKSFCKNVLGTFPPSDMIVSTKEVYSYKIPASFGSSEHE